MRKVASELGGSTWTCWKRRSSAPSFSMYLRYSLKVVAPTHWNSPRERAGLRMLAASSAPPSPSPAPTIMWSSSMKRMTSLRREISWMSAFTRSSNWPRYLVPATMPAMSSETTRIPSSTSGTSPATIFCASPSTIAVLPTPGSPISTGLFFLRRERIWITRSISFWRPTIGSSVPERARSVRSWPKWSRNDCEPRLPCSGRRPASPRLSPAPRRWARTASRAAR